MKLLKFFGKVDEDPGTLVPFVKGATPDETVSILVRRIPIDLERKLERKHKVNVQNVRMKRQHGEITVDGEQSAALTADKAAYCLMDTKNMEIEVGDDAGASFFAQLTGGTVAKGDTVRLDGLWNKLVDGRPVLKDTMLVTNPEFAQKIVRSAKTLDQLATASLEEEEEGKAKS